MVQMIGVHRVPILFPDALIFLKKLFFNFGMSLGPLKLFWFLRIILSQLLFLCELSSSHCN